MIFASVNLKGEKAWKLVLSGQKVVTRRVKPKEAGSMFAVQPNRGVKSVAHCVVISCVVDEIWRENHLKTYESKQLEAHKEGFESMEELDNWLKNKLGNPLPMLFRIEFVKRYDD